MKRNSRTFFVVFLLIVFTLSLSSTVFALAGDLRPLQQSSLPNITFLGQGPQTFTVEAPRMFLVKTYQNGQFLFVTREGPTYEADRNERVWTTDFVPNEPIRLFDEGRSYGNVQAGCVVNYVQIEDNPDQRRNTFYINGEVLQVVEQGWVTYGTFTVPEDGELTFFAEDSIGMVIELCQTVQTVTPGVTDTAEVTETVEPSVTPTVPVVTETPSPTETVPGVIITLETTTATPTATGPAVTVSPTETSPAATATFTATSPAATATNTVTVPASTATFTPTATVPGIIVTVTPGGETATPTATQSAPSPTPTNTVPAVQVQITATPIPTPGALPITGDGPGPGEIAAISAAIIALFGLLGAAWWLLLRAYNGR